MDSWIFPYGCGLMVIYVDGSFEGESNGVSDGRNSCSNN